MMVVDDDNRDHGRVRGDWRCRGCVVIVIIMTVADAKGAR